MKQHVNTISRYAIPDFFKNPIIRPYLSNVRHWQGYIRFLGLPDRREHPDVLIDRLFVEPLLTHRYVSPDEDPDDWSDDAKTVLDVLAASRAIVILGDPGIGKSTLLNHVAWLLSRPTRNPLIQRLGWALPVPMVLRELPIYGVSDFDDLMSAFLSHSMSAPLKRDNGKFLQQSLLDGNAFLLLDGIDEVGDQRVRKGLRKAVLEGFYRYPNCRWLLSSRIVGYDEVPFDPNEPGTERPEVTRSRRREPREIRSPLTGEDIATHYIAPFDDARITAFARHWYSQRDAAQDRAMDNALHLVGAIREDTSIHRLARVPNLLTMMALIHRNETTLPHGRALLYDRITEAYLESIDKFRGFDTSPHDLPRKKGWLARIGFEMQRRRMSTDDTGGSDILVDLNTVKGWLTEEMARGNVSWGTPSAEEFLDIVARRSGLFLPRGADRYAFVHLSFQDYFAAVALQREVTRLGWARSGTSRLGFHRHTLVEWSTNSVWRETFSFVFELLATEDETDWHAELLECIFGASFTHLTSPTLGQQGFHGETTLNLTLLLARLIANSRSGLSGETRNYAIRACVAALLRVQSENSFYPWRVHNVSLAILNDLLGTDTDITAKVFEEIGVQVMHFGVSTLKLRSAQVSDLTPLANLTKLQSLDLEDTQVSDLAPLANLTKLRSLDLEDTQVSDLAPLANLTKLQSLDLDDTQVSDLTPLANLTKLQSLWLNGTPVSDLAPLANLTKLRICHSARTQVSDLAPLANLIKLEHLNLNHTQVSDLAPLANLTKLQSLALDRTQVSDLTPLANLVKLESLDLDNTQVSNLTSLANLAKLESLDLNHTQVSDLAPLANLTKLERLNLDRTQVSDLAPLANLTELESLDLDNTQVSDLTPLANLTKLERLSLDNTQVSDLTPLANLTALEWLDLTNTTVPVDSVDELSSRLPNLYVIPSLER